MKKTLLGLDPGSRNFGASIVSLQDGIFKVERASVLKSPVNDLTIINEQSLNFHNELDGWQRKVSGIVAERFQSRGLKGATVECVSYMLGYTKAAFPTRPLKLITAATWKVPLQRRFQVDLKEVYHEYRFDIVPHLLDATFIAIHGLESATGKVDYSFYNIVEQAIRSKNENT